MYVINKLSFDVVIVYNEGTKKFSV